MENSKDEAMHFVEHLQSLYFEQRDLNALLPEMGENTSWIGTGEHELCQNLREAKIALSLEAKEFSGHFSIIKSKYNVSCITPDVFIVYGELMVRPDDANLADIYNRVTAVCARTREGMKLEHIHLSAPDADQENGRFYINSDEAGERETLRQRADKNAKELQKRNRQLEELTENIPGGVHQCECSEEMYFLSMSKSFLTLVGYTQEEIKIRFHNSFAEMIYPKDIERIQKEIKEQLLCGDTMSLEYRILRDDGKLLWILDQGKWAVLDDGNRCYYCVLMDITSQKEQREELRLTLERHQIIMNQTTDIIFEWDIAKDTLTFSSNWQKKFGYEAIQSTISSEIPLSENIHPMDMPAFMKIMQDSAAGIPYSETEFRIRDVLGNFRWHRIRATVLYDSQHHAIKAVGVILDIDADKKQKERLLERAQRDPLTNLYNKAAIRELVVQQMEESSGNRNQALLIIDVDNFKSVNDTYGHLCGDSLLSDVAGVLKGHFRSQDIVGRIGGDEFLVYLSDIKEKKEIATKILGLLDVLRTIKPVKGAASISCSIGVAFLPQKSEDYFTLYKCADLALYQIKAQGKNNFSFYEASDEKANSSFERFNSAIGGIDSDAENFSDGVGNKLAQYIFKMLYNSIDINTAVERLLEIVGRSYDVSRVYIFENSEDGKNCSNTFEWCNVDIPSEKENLQNIKYSEGVGDYLKNFDQNNIFYCQDINELHPALSSFLKSQKICSTLQCAILDGGEFAGFVGFDECRKNRSWTKNQVTSLTLISNILATFLLKQRLKEKAWKGERSDC